MCLIVETVTVSNRTALGLNVQGAALKNDPTPKMCLLSNSWKFLRQIL